MQCFIQTPKNWEIKTVWGRLPNEAEGLEIEADSWTGVVGEGQQAPPHQLGVWEIAVSSPSEVLGGAPTAQRFSTIFDIQDGLS